MKAFWLVLYALAPLSVAALLAVLGLLSRRLGMALEMRRYYWLYLVAAVLFVIPAISGLIVNLVLSGGDASDTSLLTVKAFVIFLPQAVGLGLAAFATGKYWRWIWGELAASGRRRSRPAEQR